VLPDTHLSADARRVVVAGAIEHRGRLLAARRSRPASLAGRWELPGGKVEPGEDPARALVRELREELALDVEVVGEVPGPLDGDWPLESSSVLRVMRVRIARGEPVAGVAHDEIRWLAPGESGALDWLDADVAPSRAALGRLDTWVDFPAGALAGTAVVTRVEVWDDGRVGVVTDRTPFHPLDHAWPDQPGDVGRLGDLPIVDAITGAIYDGGVLRVGAEVGRRRGDPAVAWVVVHVLEAPAPVHPGDVVALEVDAQRRSRYSRGHSACHLAALALNESSARYWSKEPPRRDSRGFPFLDQLAIQESRIVPDGSYDAYRCGRSLRKAGFDADAFLRDSQSVVAQAHALLDTWVATGALSRVDTDGDPTLPARRRWRCELPGSAAVIPCGGTHVADIAELGQVRVSYAPTEEGFEALTTVA
jgi:alanyl-tRNA synthetase